MNCQNFKQFICSTGPEEAHTTSISWSFTAGHRKHTMEAKSQSWQLSCHHTLGERVGKWAADFRFAVVATPQAGFMRQGQGQRIVNQCAHRPNLTYLEKSWVFYEFDQIAWGVYVVCATYIITLLRLSTYYAGLTDILLNFTSKHIYPKAKCMHDWAQRSQAEIKSRDESDISGFHFDLQAKLVHSTILASSCDSTGGPLGSCEEKNDSSFVKLYSDTVVLSA